MRNWPLNPRLLACDFSIRNIVNMYCHLLVDCPLRIHLRVIARKKLTVYYRGCRRPDSDFDETRSSRSFWAKTKFETPLFAIRAHRGVPRGLPRGQFWPSEKAVFWPNFFSLKPQGNVYYGFFGGFHPRNVQPLKFLRYLEARARSGPQRAQEGPGRQHFYTSRYHKNFSSQA